MTNKRYEDLTFEELLVLMAETDKENVALSVLKNAKSGDASAMKLLQVFWERANYQQAEKLMISDEQMKQIIKLAAERITLKS